MILFFRPNFIADSCFIICNRPPHSFPHTQKHITPNDAGHSAELVVAGFSLTQSQWTPRIPIIINYYPLSICSIVH